MTHTGTGPHAAGPHDGHLDADAVADLDEGLLGPEDASRAQRHLAGCAGCSGMLSDLHELRLLLGTGADVAPVPAHVVTRLDEALAQAQAEEDAAAGRPDPVVVRLRPRRSARARQVVMAVAAVAAAGIVAVPLVNGLLSRSGDDSSSGAGAASDAAGVNEGPQESGIPPPRAPSLSRSGTSYTAATLATAAGRLLPDAAPSNTPGRVPSVAGSWIERLRDPAALRACVTGLRSSDASLGAEPLAVDLAAFEGREAAILVFARTTPLDDQTVAVAVGPSCDAAAPDVLGRAVLGR